MNLDYLDFEQPIAELEEKIQTLDNIKGKANIKDKADIINKIKALKSKSNALTKKIFSSLSDWQISQLARHPKRLYTLDYISDVFDEFTELHGDRTYGDDHAIIGGIATLDNQPVMFIGQQKGRTTQEKIKYNFGMPRPEGYRKALRLMKLAEKFSMPIVTFIDTPGAYPGIGAEERGQSEAIAKNLFEMSTLPTPIISIVIGEGGSGGALAIGVADIIMMFEYSIYSVISPEGCASILYKDVTKANLAAESLKLTSIHLKKERLIDVVINEPLGGIHRNPSQAKVLLKEVLTQQLNKIKQLPIEQLLQNRQKKLLGFGKFKD
ncbi:acetyl-CoA carboxylase carboxyltransferase subunit alpha [Candidatus Vesicomyidisocius calyptogenae]|uniref:Acetyl-coenzyme A carboxylase carboxyl transferase subunit alpha n=1 Tax=Vesicomyosocius okutanii subsp. Calyptogena okutanii (strain HA) TaxID=412965 RepID=ACCA_VESOH|nr:acetyl-CoA carboxylase carboxyltransferase subunit alpha [Candidatus Vesicomyosocius okutanii]A5CXS3.1 RecName: Full=Acetyl-coenzyme A carboxylase carboxyl transferase subunit alpha; Short=ACCase subunit alpha; Short=Acetyl-CoA carboxylase carboxyltransferase subunit alpha [Candidatus Vesicomyosocius okutanii]BAF61261.1 acetyl-CoA carboxylase carboxyl transferase subunit alpha [Candidatus Vesicomyosocius okutanii]